MPGHHPISRVTLGTVQLGLNYGIANKEGKPGEEKAFAILDEAFSAGVNCLDTAAAYGDSEIIIGKYLSTRRIKRDDIYIATKFKTGSVSSFLVEKVIRESVENSLKNLETDYIDILLLHNAQELLASGNEITKTVEKLLKEGTIKRAGVSCYKFNEIEDIVENEIWQAFQLPVNLLDMRIAASENARKLENKFIFARSLFLQGLFFLEPENLRGNLREISGYLLEIRKIAGELNRSTAQLAVSYVNSLEFIDSMVIGADNPGHVRENAKFLETEPMDHDTRNMIEARLKGAPEWLFSPGLWDRQTQ